MLIAVGAELLGLLVRRASSSAEQLTGQGRKECSPLAALVKLVIEGAEVNLLQALTVCCLVASHTHSPSTVLEQVLFGVKDSGVGVR